MPPCPTGARRAQGRHSRAHCAGRAQEAGRTDTRPCSTARTALEPERRRLGRRPGCSEGSMHPPSRRLGLILALASKSSGGLAESLSRSGEPSARTSPGVWSPTAPHLHVPLPRAAKQASGRPAQPGMAPVSTFQVSPCSLTCGCTHRPQPQAAAAMRPLQMPIQSFTPCPSHGFPHPCCSAGPLPWQLLHREVEPCAGRSWPQRRLHLPLVSPASGAGGGGAGSRGSPPAPAHRARGGAERRLRREARQRGTRARLPAALGVVQSRWGVRSPRREPTALCPSAPLPWGPSGVPPCGHRAWALARARA